MAFCAKVVAVVAFVALALVGVDAVTKTNFADVRLGVSHAFHERAHEMSATLDAVQQVSRATLQAIEVSKAKCESA